MAQDELARHCVELFMPLGVARARRMFGGHGVYVDDLFVAVIAGERIFLKADALTRAQFEAAGCEPFRYERRGETVALGYWSAPAQALESAEQMRPWARLAMAAALRARSAMPTARRHKPASAAAAAPATARQPQAARRARRR